MTLQEANKPSGLGEVRQVLIVDGCELTRKQLTHLLETIGMETIEALSATDAVKLFLEHEQRIALVLMDVIVPQGDGRQLCQLIRSISNVPIITVSTLYNEQSLLQMLNVGADDFIIKPFNERELVARIQAALRRHAITLRTMRRRFM